MVQTITPEDFRHTMSQFATGVTVISARDTNGQPHGMTVSSFASLSLDPPLILWSIKTNSYSASTFLSAKHFAVNILSAAQEEVSRNFCRPIDRFATVDWEDGLEGLPLIRGSLSWIECALEDALEGGDHKIVVGRVLRARSFDHGPLVHWRGHYVKDIALPILEQAAAHG